VSDCYVESHWQGNGFIDGGGQCGTGNCSTTNYWVLRNNRGGYGADIGESSPHLRIPFGLLVDCIADTESRQATTL